MAIIIVGLQMSVYYPPVHTRPYLWHNRAMPRHPLHTTPTTLAEHLDCMRKELPHIRPFEEEDDIYWWNNGLDALEANQLSQADRIFKKLTLAQPEHFDGYYDLAQVYQHQGQLAAAVLFADEAIRLAEAMLPEGDLDPLMVEELKTFRAQFGPAA
jgi:tetratricopeptide (TPR) repeat protein